MKTTRRTVLAGGAALAMAGPAHAKEKAMAGSDLFTKHDSLGLAELVRKR